MKAAEVRFDRTWRGNDGSLQIVHSYARNMPNPMKPSTSGTMTWYVYHAYTVPPHVKAIRTEMTAAMKMQLPTKSPKSVQHMRIAHYKHSADRLHKRLDRGSDQPDIWNLVSAQDGAEKNILTVP